VGNAARVLAERRQCRILDDEVEIFDGVRFIGGHAMDRHGPRKPPRHGDGAARQNDYAIVTDAACDDARHDGRAGNKRTSRSWNAELAVQGPKVVITHHPPSLLSLNRNTRAMA